MKIGGGPGSTIPLLFSSEGVTLFTTATLGILSLGVTSLETDSLTVAALFLFLGELTLDFYPGEFIVESLGVFSLVKGAFFTIMSMPSNKYYCYLFKHYCS